MAERLKLRLPLIVEGRYDKSALSGFVDGVIITTGGFSIFNNKEKQALIRRISEGGIVVLTDSDGGGRQIRSFLSGILPSDKIHHIFIPKIEGKEKRKRAPSRSGTLGVEGMERLVLERLLLPFCIDAGEAKAPKKAITKTDFYLDGLSGADGASQRRAKICKLAGLPDDMTAKALLEAVNLLLDYDEYKAMITTIESRNSRISTANL